jgi:hypothetical protein
VIVVGVVVLVVVVLGAGGWAARRTSLAPAPAFGRRSLRRQALGLLGVGRAEQLRRGWEGYGGALAHVLVPLVLLTIALVPSVDVGFGPFAQADASRSYLGTAWQVVAAAVGVSVALIAFVFQAFMSSGARYFGGTLREFVDETGLLWLFDLAAASLVLDGLVLADVGSRGPAGWSGLSAALLSGVTLVSLLVVVPRAIVRVLDPGRLMTMRRRKGRAVIRRAMQEQLVGQVVATQLHRREAETQIAPDPLTREGPGRVLAGRDGVLADVRLGPLWRAVRRLGLEADARVHLPVDVDKAVAPDTLLAVAPIELGWRRRHELRRALPVTRTGEPASVALARALEQLQRQALDAVARRDENEWRELSRLLEEQLAELVRQAGRLGVAFEGPVSDPGLFRHGPAARIFDVFDEVLEQAMRDGVTTIVDNVLYVPHALAYEIRDFEAGGLIARMAGLYARALYLASTEDATGSVSEGVQRHVRRSAVEQLFELVQRVGGDALAHDGLEGERLERAQTNVRRAMSAVPGVLRAIVTRRDEADSQLAQRKWGEVFEFWEEWRHDERAGVQRALLYDMRVVRVAVAAWALDQLIIPDPAEPDVLRRMATTLLAGVSPDDLVTAYHDLARRRQRVGDDISWWWYDEERSGVQSLDAESRLAVAVVVGLALQAQAGPPAIPAAAELGYDYPRFEAAVERVRHNGAFGDEVADGLDAAADALRTAHEREQRTERDKVIEGALDPERIVAFEAAVRRAAAGQRVLVEALKARGRWAEVVSVPERAVTRSAGKQAFMDRPEYVGQDTMARTLGNKAGLIELRDLVEATAGVPAIEATDVRTGVTDAVASLREAGGAPDLILVGLDWALHEQLGLVRGQNAIAAAEVTQSRALAEKALGTFEGVPVVQHVDLTERVVVVDFAAVRMEEQATDDGSGVRPEVVPFDAETARRWVAEHGGAQAGDGEAESEDPVERVQQQVLLRAVVLWRLTLVDAEKVRVIRVGMT